METTIFVGDLDMEEEDAEGGGALPDELPEGPVEGPSAADRRRRVPLQRRLVHRHHYPRRRLRCHIRCHSLSLSLSKNNFGGDFLVKWMASRHFTRHDV